MTNYYKRIERNLKGRDIIVGDVHGCFTKLREALDRIKFDDSAGDRLFFVGDLVDRGPESLDALWWLAQPWAHAVGGNHEDMAIRWPNGNMDWGNYAANGGSWMIALDRETQLEVAAALSAMPVAIELETAVGPIGVVHAECPLPSWREFVQRLEDPDLSNNKRGALIDAAQWSRTRIELQDVSPVSDVVAVVVGHTPMRQSVTLGNHIYIDTMGWRGGEFTLLDAATLQPV
jgi:serine/threonine protein phosphatase 1